MQEPKDEELTEEEALKQAEVQGITFIDEFTIAGIEANNQVAGPFNTREQAEKKLATYSNANEFTILQIRRQKQD